MNEPPKFSFHNSYSAEYTAANRRSNLTIWFVRKVQARKPVKCSCSKHTPRIWHPTDFTVLYIEVISDKHLGVSHLPSFFWNKEHLVWMPESTNSWQWWNKQIGFDTKYNAIPYLLKILSHFMVFDTYIFAMSLLTK